MRLAKVVESVDINAPRDEVFEVVANRERDVDHPPALRVLNDVVQIVPRAFPAFRVSRPLIDP